MAGVIQNRLHVYGEDRDLDMFYDRLESKHGYVFSTDKLLGNREDVPSINTNVPVIRGDRELITGFASLGEPPIKLCEVMSETFKDLRFMVECFPKDGRYNFKLKAAQGKVAYC